MRHQLKLATSLSLALAESSSALSQNTNMLSSSTAARLLPRNGLNRSVAWSVSKQQSQGYVSRVSRMFGTKAGVPGNPPGTVELENIQQIIPDIDEERLTSTVEQIRDIIGYPTYDVNLYLVDDDLMQETNRDTRGIDKPTDILSFPFLNAVEPGVLSDPEFDVPDMYCLGEMMIDVPYVIRRCEEDKADNEKLGEDEEQDRGVSGAMATVYDPEERINMLLVHGMLHLLGHDHEADDEYKIMVSKEEEILEQLGMSREKG